MTTVAISGLPVAAAINATDIIPFVQPATAGTTKSITKDKLFTSPTMITPVLGAATGTSLALTGLATVGTTLGVTGATTLSSTLAVTGVSTLTGGAVVQGMTVGLGLAAVATNTALGFDVLQANTTGNSNVGVGYRTLRLNLAGEYNFAGGFEALKSNTGGVENTAVGALALSGNAGGDYNTAVGLSALGTQITGNSNVALGYYAGNYETGSNAFYVNNQDRTNTAGDKALSLLYGTFNTTAATQTLVVNAGSSTFTGAVVVGAPAPASISAVATLTNANLQAQLINTTGVSYTVTMPLGSTLDTLITWAAVDIGFDFSVINTASGTITIAANTGVTTLGGLTIATGVSAQFRIRRTAASTYVMYRIA